MTSLREARLQAHWAAQLASLPGTSLLEARDDYSHTNLHWSHDLQALVGQAVKGASAALRVADLTLLVGDAELPLHGRTMAEGTAWLGERFGAPMGHWAHPMPPHQVGDGAVFGHPSGLPDLAGCFDRAQTALTALGGAVHSWPHHFDIASLFAFGDGRSVGVGLSPGDGSYPEPYWYVTPWPYPDSPDRLPELPAGAWHTEGWTGAVLPGLEDPEPFLAPALALCKQVVLS